MDTCRTTRFFSEGGIIICATLKDRMVDNGLIGAMLVQKQEILQSVLSCRVFGLSVEQAMLSFATRFILLKYDDVRSYVVNTGKNFTCHNFYKSLLFSEESAGVFASKEVVPFPEHIQEVEWS